MAENGRYRMTVWLDPARDLPLDDELQNVPEDKRASLMRTFAVLGAYQWKMVKAKRSGIDVAEATPEAETTIMSLSGAMD